MKLSKYQKEILSAKYLEEGQVNEIETLQELEVAEKDNLAMSKISEEQEFLELLVKLQSLPRPRLRTAMREMVNILGKETIKELLS